MSTDSTKDKPQLSEPAARGFIRLILDFFVGVAVGLAPFLGTQKIPFFRALISIMPFQISNELIALSAFIMGLIVAAIQFYSSKSSKRISQRVLGKRFAIALVTMLVGFLLFYFLRNEFTVDVARGQSEETVTVLIGSTAFPYEPQKEDGCHCPDATRNPEACIQRLSFDAGAIAHCWSYREIRRRGELLGLSYLLLTGGVGVLIGLILLQERARHASRNRGARQRPREASST